MKLLILETKESNELNKQFIDCWSGCYNHSYKYEKEYTSIIGKTEFTKEDIQKLYEWKNGSNLSERKQNSLDEKIKAKLDIINQFKRNFELDKFKNEFKNVSAVWKLFLLHIIQPKVYPIYDQHVQHRKFVFRLQHQQIFEVAVSKSNAAVGYQSFEIALECVFYSQSGTL